MFKRKITLITFITILALLIGITTGCKVKEENKVSDSKPKNNEKVDYHKDNNPVVTIVMENNKVIKIELYPQIAPNTVNNFISLIDKGYYDGIIFHRVIPQFMVQGGDPEGTGVGGPGYNIKGEFTANNFENQLSHNRGVISMARRRDSYDSAGSQFFIMVEDIPSLDGEYASFGKVIEGMEAVDEIVNVERDVNHKPLKDIVMKKVTVDKKGVTYKEPQKLNNK